jgi:acyl carrier protein
LAEIWGSQLGLESVGIYDRFFDLGGHSLLAAQIAAEICDRCQIELPVVKIFQAPTVAELAVVVDQAKLGTTDSPEAALSMSAAAGASAGAAAPELQGDAPEVATKLGYREFYNDVSRRLAQSGMGAASFFLNYGYKSSSDDENAPEDEACVEIPAEVFNRNSVRLAFELVGNTPLAGRPLLDVGC